VPLLEKVKALGIPIVGVISDKEKGLVPAIARALPDKPHQFCQSHYLANVRKPMDDDLASLGKGIADVVSAVRKLARKVETIEERADCESASAGAELPAVEIEEEDEDEDTNALDVSPPPASSAEPERVDTATEEVKIVKQLAGAALAAGKASGDPILGPTAVKRYERLERVRQVAQQAAAKSGEHWPLLASLIAALTVLTQHAALAERLIEQVSVVRKIAHILNFQAPGRQIKRMLKTYLNSLAKRSQELKAGPLAAYLLQVVSVSNRYWSGLFHCYDNKDIPRTNNDTEQLFNVFKRHLRKITGGKSTAGGPVESGAAFVLEAWSAVRLRPQLLELLCQVPPDKLLAARKELEAIAEPARQRRSIQRDPERYLKEIITGLEEWVAAAENSG
jgi:hypothetical protein